MKRDLSKQLEVNAAGREEGREEEILRKVRWGGDS